MYPEVEQYLDALRAAEKTEQKARAEARAAQEAAHKAAKANGWQRPAGSCCTECAYNETPLGKLLEGHFTAIYRTSDTAENAAWDALRASEVPLVRWIAENCREYRWEAGRVLAELPAPIEELDALATAAGWCGVWGRFRRYALAAGVVADAPQGSESEVSA